MSVAKPWFWTDEDDAALKRMWEEGALNKEIAAAIGCMDYQVEYRLAGMKLGKRPRRESARWAAAKSGPVGAPVNQWAGGGQRDQAFAAAMAGRRFENVILKPSVAPARVYSVSRTEHRGASSLEINA